MLQFSITRTALVAVAIWLLTIVLSGCARLNLPAIDPTGNRIFLPAPSSTTILGPFSQRNNDVPTYPGQPAFSHPADPPPCNAPATASAARRCLIPPAVLPKSPGKSGQIIMTPSRIIAPVSSEVVVLAGICGGDGYFVLNQPLEWMLSNDSVGQFIEVGGTANHPTFNRLVSPAARKFDGQYAWGRSGLQPQLITRGTPTPADDIQLLKGQAFISLSSVSSGTSYVTCVAPKSEAWDKRRSSTIIHWVDAIWSIPVPTKAAAGTVLPLTTVVTRSTDGGGVEGWKVRYSIVGGAPAEFAPTGSRDAEVTTGSDGKATVQIRQLAGQFDPGATQVRVDVIRPKLYGEEELVVESGITTVNWSAPALTIRAIGPQTAGIDEAFSYRVEVSNPGDLITRGVKLRTRSFPSDLEFISSNPKPVVYGNQYEWDLGDIAPASEPRVVDVQLKSKSRGNQQLCFEISSETDQLRTEACAQTEIVVPCLGIQVDGPTQSKVGQQATFEITVINQCEEPLDEIELKILYDDGLNATGFGNPIGAKIGRLEFNERKSLPVVFDVMKSGKLCFEFKATANGGHTANGKRCIDVDPGSAASVNLQMEGQRQVVVGGKTLIRGIVSNVGDVPLSNVTVINRFSNSLVPDLVTDKYPHRWTDGRGDELIFDLGTLEPGESAFVELQFLAEKIDGNAFSEMTVSSPDVTPSTRRYDMRIEDLGSGAAQEPGLEIPDDDTPGGQPAGEQPGANQGSGGRNDSTGQPVQPDFGGGRPSGEQPIQIPDDPSAGSLAEQRGDLSIRVRTLDRQTAINGTSRIEFTVTNNSSRADSNVDISMLLPPSIRLVAWSDQQNPLPIVANSGDNTRFDLQRVLSMRPGDSLTFVATVEGVQPGVSTFEVRVASDNSVGTVTADDKVMVVQ